jgi:hypothetical protein
MPLEEKKYFWINLNKFFRNIDLFSFYFTIVIVFNKKITSQEAMSFADTAPPPRVTWHIFDLKGLNLAWNVS